ncbi:hypothetical protein MNBD_PLANCTO02-678 [hydrothermal vent metagenome]|uniref:Cardiolipin synthase N-terminal domain-containing protein n=1 Tax=hydrothermal vent metagenome TaxID=652676 RepID=A0A3B1DQ28_9ZZZZ
MEAIFPLIFILMWGFGILLSLGSFALMVWMLIDCLTKEPSEGNDKLIWALVILFGGCIGAPIYYFIRRPERIEKYGE